MIFFLLISTILEPRNNVLNELLNGLEVEQYFAVDLEAMTSKNKIHLFFL